MILVSHVKRTILNQNLSLKVVFLFHSLGLSLYLNPTFGLDEGRGWSDVKMELLNGKD